MTIIFTSMTLCHHGPYQHAPDHHYYGTSTSTSTMITRISRLHQDPAVHQWWSSTMVHNRKQVCLGAMVPWSQANTYTLALANIWLMTETNCLWQKQSFSDRNSVPMHISLGCFDKNTRSLLENKVSLTYLYKKEKHKKYISFFVTLRMNKQYFFLFF